MFAALESLRSSLPTLPDFNLSSFKSEEEIPYINDFEGITEDKKMVEKKEILEKLLDNLSIEAFPTFILYAANNIILGKQANSIHPFNTFEFFLSTEVRIEKTKKIYHKTGIQLGFEHFKTQSIKGFVYFLEERHKKNELLPNLDKFCKKTRKDKALLQSFIEDNKFEEFVKEILMNF
ncbi:MAG TPA: hypothetical protein ENH96_01650 [Chlamydiae bacterium]|nr:hypothetical protein [Chlamydiota bacterium]